ncbi:MAG: PKD domain-containing protein [Thermoplasmata archaeon]|nr:PKD domain-containing protein [Thermoplasmata archaeon]
MTWDAGDGYVLLFGGMLIGVHYATDSWTFQDGSWTNITSMVTGTPPPLLFPELAYDSTSMAVVLFGMLVNGPPAMVTWTYHNKVWTNISAIAGTAPSPRISFAFSPDTTDSGLLLFGGRSTNGSGALSDSWTFQADHWRNITPTAGWSFGIAITPTGADDPPDHGVLLYGGNLLNSTTVRAATYLFRSGNWQNLSSSVPVQPTSSLFPQAQYLPGLRSVVVYQPDFVTKSGGIGFYSSTIAYQADAWTNLTLLVGGPPSVGYQEATAALGGGAGILAFGGLSGTGLLTFTWVLSGAPQASANVSRTSVDDGGTVSFTGTASGGTSPYAYHWAFGDGSNSTVLSPSHAFSTPGLHTVTFTATDLLGRTASAVLGVEVNPSLTLAAAALPTPTTVGSTVSYIAQVTGGAAPYAYHWDLGDATTASSAAPHHTYTKAGNYTVSLNHTDALGTSTSATTTVEVKSASTAAPSNTSGSSGVSLTSGTGLYLLLGIIVLAAVVAALGVLLARRPRSPPGPPAPYLSGPGAPPPAAVANAPPPGGSQAPPPPSG